MTGYGRRSVTYVLVVAAAVALTVSQVAVPDAPAAPSGWNIVPSASTGAGDSNLLLGSTCANAWNCWAVGGSFPDINNGMPSALINHWDGASWSVAALAPPPSSDASLLWNVTCVTASDCWAVGGQELGTNAAPSTLAEHWDGSAWSVVPTPATFGYLFSVTCNSTADCWAAGTSVAADNSGPLNGIIDHWDGASWSAVPTAPSGQTYDQFNSVACTGPADCWAVGYSGPNQQQNNFLPNVAPNVAGDGAFAEHWDGAAWSAAPVPQATAPLGSYLSSVTCTSPSECFAVGATMDAAGDPSATLVDAWNGSSWTGVSSPSPSSTSGLLTDVTCLDASRCWAVGVFGYTSGQNGAPSPFVESWNGSQWSIEPSPDVTAFGYLDGLACVRGVMCLATGFAVTDLNNNTTTLATLVEQLQLPPGADQGLWMSGSDGGVFSLGDAAYLGSMGEARLNRPVVGMAPTPDGRGYWLVASDGGVFSFGDARFAGSLGAVALNAPIVGMAPTPDGGGYWLVAADGGVFTFGDAAYWGSVPGQGIGGVQVVGMAPTPDGRGYWLVDQAGGVYAYGDATFLGALTGARLAGPITGVAAQ
jgi:hypothetical protein